MQRIQSATLLISNGKAAGGKLPFRQSRIGAWSESCLVLQARYCIEGINLSS
jgi:hypothetical protein